MVLIDIFSGFLGAGKTTLIKKLIAEAYAGEKVVLIENEFGEIGIDGGFMQEAGIEVTEMNSGCICCSLVGDFSKALKEVANRYQPDRIIIEPSGVGKLSDVIKAVENARVSDSRLNSACAVVDAKKCKMYLKNFGEFFLDQVKHATCIVLSHTAGAGEKITSAVEQLRAHTNATIVTTDWNLLSGRDILSAIEQTNTLTSAISDLEEEHHHAHCHHDHDHDHCHHDHDHEHCHHDHDHNHEHCHHDHEHDHDHCHHDHDHECCHHDHDHDHEHCHHDHDHHEHHHADEVFQSWGIETAKIFDLEQLASALKMLDSGKYGNILRAKGIVQGKDGWIYFDYVPEEADIRTGNPSVTGRLCVIGCDIKEEELSRLFLG